VTKNFQRRPETPYFSAQV